MFLGYDLMYYPMWTYNLYMSSQCQVTSHLYAYLTHQMHQIHDNIHFTVWNTT